MTLEKIKELQNCVRYTVFFQKVEEFLFIFAEIKKFRKDNFSEINQTIVFNDNLKLLLHFLHLLIYQDYENLTLLMNFKANIFINTFIDIKDNLMDFLDSIAEMLFRCDIEYKYDNYYFFCDCLIKILDLVHFDNLFIYNELNDKEELDRELIDSHFSVIERVMKICKRTIKFISMNQPEALDCVEKIVEKIRFMKNDQNLQNMFNNYFFDPDDMKVVVNYSEGACLTNLEKFIGTYLDFFNELIFYDLYFYGVIRDLDDFIYPNDTVEHIFESRSRKKMQFAGRN